MVGPCYFIVPFVNLANAHEMFFETLPTCLSREWLDTQRLFTTTVGGACVGTEGVVLGTLAVGWTVAAAMGATSVGKVVEVVGTGALQLYAVCCSGAPTITEVLCGACALV